MRRLSALLTGLLLLSACSSSTVLEQGSVLPLDAAVIAEPLPSTSAEPLAAVEGAETAVAGGEASGSTESDDATGDEDDQFASPSGQLADAPEPPRVEAPDSTEST